MTSWGRRFVLSGLVLIAAGFLFALVFTLSLDHEARLVAHDAYRPVFELIAGQGESAEWQPLEEAISARSKAHRRAVDVHGHAINMGVLLVLIGLLMPLMSETAGRHAAPLAALIASAFLYPLGLMLQLFRFVTAGEILAAIGAIGAIGALAVLFLALVRRLDSATGQ